MNSLAGFFGFVIAAIGVAGVADPWLLLEATSFLLTETGLWAAAAFRIIVGVVLVKAAAMSRMPRTLHILGVLIILGGIATPFIGLDRARAIVDWWSTRGLVFMRSWAALAVLLGSFIMYAARSRRPTPAR